MGAFAAHPSCGLFADYQHVTRHWLSEYALRQSGVAAKRQADGAPQSAGGERDGAEQFGYSRTGRSMMLLT